jgi:hypothetical protein
MEKLRIATHPDYLRDLNTGAIILNEIAPVNEYQVAKAQARKKMLLDREKDQKILSMDARLQEMQEQILCLAEKIKSLKK